MQLINKIQGVSLNKILPILFIVVLPFFVWGRNILQGQINGFVFLSLLMAVLLLPNVWLKIIGIIATGWLGFAYAIDFIGSFPISPFVDASLVLFFAIVFYLFVYHTKYTFEFYAKIICISALIQTMISICQWLWFDPVSFLMSTIVIVKGTGIVGSLGNPNFLGAYLAISLPFFFRSRWVWFIPVIIIGLLISKTSTAIIGAIIGTAFFIGGWRFAVCGIVPVGIYLMVSTPAGTALNVRLDYWIDATKTTCRSLSSFIVGYGQGTTWRLDNQIHNEYVATFFNYGITGLACMIAYIATISRNNKILFTAFIILCVNMIGNHPLHVVTTAILAIVISALIERGRHD